uniref:Methyltransferase like 17 n=1 Tax=Pipistrellus kuhlii TaxID=59472 RepID=A0A7J8B267_PIPKU|nr:methyltransferase like 17 [Pipistrellus kuhlii]
MATASGPSYLLSLGRWHRGFRVAPQSRALAALVPGVSQVDNKSGFLEKRPHRRHPGILKLPCVRLPRALADAAQVVLLEHSVPNVEKQVQALTNYLWSRHLPVEPEELQRRAAHLEKKFLENSDTRFEPYSSLFSPQTHFRQKRNFVKQCCMPYVKLPTIGKN